MKQAIILFMTFLLMATGCTREVPENEKKLIKSADEANIRNAIENFTTAYNDGNMDAAIIPFDENYREITSDSVDIIGLEALRSELEGYNKQYPEGKWQINIEEITVSDGMAYALCSGSFLMPDPAEKKMNPVHSERSIRVFRKDKMSGWKIYRYMALPTFSYDDK